MSTLLHIGFVADCRSPITEVRQVSFDDLAARLSEIKPGSKDGPAFVPAEIETGPRKGERVKAVDVLVIDVEAEAEPVKDDAGQPMLDKHGDQIKRVIGVEPPELPDLLSDIQRLGWRAAAHTSYSHCGSILPEGVRHPRYRVVFHLSRPLQPAEVRPLGLHVAQSLGILDCIDKACLEPARLFYLPRAPEERLCLFEHGQAEGGPLPVDKLLEEAGKQANAQPGRQPGSYDADDDVFAKFNDAHDIGAILERHDYKKARGQRWLRPGSTSAMPGIVSLPDSRPQRIYAHGNDPLFSDGKSHDAFDVWRMLKGLDLSAAAREARILLGMKRTHQGREEKPLDDDSVRLVEQAIAKLEQDAGAVFEKPILDLLRRVKASDPAAFARYRDEIKKTKRVQIAMLDRLLTGDDNDSNESASIATRLAGLAADRCSLWHDNDGNAYASLDREHLGAAHREHWRIDSSSFQEWLSWLAHNELGSAPASEAIKLTCNSLAGKAKFDGEEHSAHIRVAKADGGIWIDLCDDKWRAVLVTSTGWRIVDKPDRRFIRTRAMRALPVPVVGGRIDPIWQLVNIPEEDRPLVLAWLLEALRPGTPYPVIEYMGEQGSAKSTTQSTLRHFIDPNKVMLRSLRTKDDLFVAAGANHVISLENLSSLHPEISDALCAISTGGGTAGRQLYTNSEESIIEAHNPIMLNGIGAVVTRPDLLDRTIALCLPTITSRITEAEHLAMMEEHESEIMGGLLSLLADTLAKLPEVVISQLRRPRMADFAHLGEAMYQALGNQPGEWLELYDKHRREAIRRTIDSLPVAVACIDYVEKGYTYAGTVGGLLTHFNQSTSPLQSLERGDYWPKSAKGMGDQLRRAAPALRQIGVHLSVETKPRRDGMHCQLRKGPAQPFSTLEPDDTEEVRL